MRVERIADPERFVEAAWEFLVRREAEHNLILGLCPPLRRNPRLYGHDPYFAVVEEGGRIVGAALRTPPHNLVLSELDVEGAAEALALDMREAFHELPGVLGPVDGARAFVRSWEALAGAHGRLARSERIYRAESVTPPGVGEGRMRPYAPG